MRIRDTKPAGITRDKRRPRLEPQYPTVLFDAAHITGARSGATDEQRKGIIVGLVAGMVAYGWLVDEAVSYLRDHIAKHNLDGIDADLAAFDAALPESWR